MTKAEQDAAALDFLIVEVKEGMMWPRTLPQYKQMQRESKFPTSRVVRTMSGQLATGPRAFGSAKLPTLSKMCEQRGLDNRGTRNTLCAPSARHGVG